MLLYKNDESFCGVIFIKLWRVKDAVQSVMRHF